MVTSTKGLHTERGIDTTEMKTIVEKKPKLSDIVNNGDSSYLSFIVNLS